MNSFDISLGVAAQYILAFSNLGTKDLVSLIHPAIAVILVFPSSREHSHPIPSP